VFFSEHSVHVEVQLFLLNCSYEPIYFRSCKLVNLQTRGNSSYAYNVSMSFFPCQSVMKVSKCVYCLNCPKFGQLILTHAYVMLN